MTREPEMSLDEMAEGIRQHSPRYSQAQVDALLKEEREKCKDIDALYKDYVQNATGAFIEKLKSEIRSCVTAEGNDFYFLKVAKDSPIFTAPDTNQTEV